jgi:hypothetical protein
MNNQENQIVPGQNSPSSLEMGEIIEVRNLSKKFGFTAVDNISFEVYKEKFLVFLGQMEPEKQLP